MVVMYLSDCVLSNLVRATSIAVGDGTVEDTFIFFVDDISIEIYGVQD